MIRFNYKGVNYFINFKRIDTSYTCIIGEESGEGYFVLGQGTSRLGKKDNFVKEKGRFVALKKALKDVDANKGKDINFNKHLWKVYNSRKENPKHDEIWIDGLTGELIKIGKNVKYVLVHPLL